MKIIIGGTRGTSPVAQPEAVRFGGETTSVLVRSATRDTVVLDAGTGLRVLGRRALRDPPTELLLLLTHFHLDHIMGWPSFPLLYHKGVTLRVASAHEKGREAQEILSRLMRPPLWPVQMDHVRAELRFGPPPASWGTLTIRSCAVHHPGGCMAYRLDEPATGASVVFASDIEWPLSTKNEREAFLRLCREPSPCRLLLFDGQFNRATYPSFEGWGHSRWQDAVEVAQQAGAERLRIIHHAPDNTDEQLSRIDRRALALYPGAGLARDGMEIDL